MSKNKTQALCRTGLSEVVQLTLQLNLAVAEKYYFLILLILNSSRSSCVISLSRNKIIVLLVHFLNCKVELTSSTVETHITMKQCQKVKVVD